MKTWSVSLVSQRTTYEKDEQSLGWGRGEGILNN